jgi:hypothetical protein
MLALCEAPNRQIAETVSAEKEKKKLYFKFKQQMTKSQRP